MAVGGALVYSPEAENWDLAKLYTVFKLPQAFWKPEIQSTQVRKRWYIKSQ